MSADDDVIHLRLSRRMADKLDQIVECMDDDPESHRRDLGREGRPRALRYLIARVHKELELGRSEQQGGSGV